MHRLALALLLTLATVAHSEEETLGYWASNPDGTGWCTAITAPGQCCYIVAKDDKLPKQQGKPNPPVLPVATASVEITLDDNLFAPEPAGGGVAAIRSCQGPNQIECAKNVDPVFLYGRAGENRMTLQTTALLASVASLAESRLTVCGK